MTEIDKSPYNRAVCIASSWRFHFAFIVLASIAPLSIVNPVSAIGGGLDADKAEVSSASKFTRSRAVRYSAILAGGGLAFALDRDLRKFYQKPRLHGKMADSFFKEVENFGAQTPYFFIVPAFIGYGLVARNEKSLGTGGELAIGLLTSYGVTSGIKELFGRKRPYESDSPYEFFSGGSSFYSGHTVTVFTAATIISSNYPRQYLGFAGIDRDVPIVPVVCYSLAAMVGIQRLYSDVHWSSDVYAGALMGLTVGKIVHYFGQKMAPDFALYHSNSKILMVASFALK